MNMVVIEGNLTKDPEMRYTPTGKALTEFSVAVNEGTGDKRTTEFIDCVAWEPFAEPFAERARKGMRVTVTGKLHTETWTDRQTQQKRKATKVKCYSVAIHERAVAAARPAEAPTEDEFDDLPF